mmetsp:Transcript_18270/g.40417  ORF Transcript_18270/g.40417 Transcript_18270/m.40417 type:complete len:569 (-) Transcript_18270:35-1741(-)
MRLCTLLSLAAINRASFLSTRTVIDGSAKVEVEPELSLLSAEDAPAGEEKDAQLLHEGTNTTARVVTVPLLSELLQTLQRGTGHDARPALLEALHTLREHPDAPAALTGEATNTTGTTLTIPLLSEFLQRLVRQSEAGPASVPYLTTLLQSPGAGSAPAGPAGVDHLALVKELQVQVRALSPGGSAELLDSDANFTAAQGEQSKVVTVPLLSELLQQVLAQHKGDSKISELQTRQARANGGESADTGDDSEVATVPLMSQLQESARVAAKAAEQFDASDETTEDSEVATVHLLSQLQEGTRMAASSVSPGSVAAEAPVSPAGDADEEDAVATVELLSQLQQAARLVPADTGSELVGSNQTHSVVTIPLLSELLQQLRKSGGQPLAQLMQVMRQGNSTEVTIPLLSELLQQMHTVNVTTSVHDIAELIQAPQWSELAQFLLHHTKATTLAPTHAPESHSKGGDAVTVKLLSELQRSRNQVRPRDQDNVDEGLPTVPAAVALSGRHRRARANRPTSNIQEDSDERVATSFSQVVAEIVAHPGVLVALIPDFGPSWLLHMFSAADNTTQVQ